MERLPREIFELAFPGGVGIGHTGNLWRCQWEPEDRAGRKLPRALPPAKERPGACDTASPWRPASHPGGPASREPRSPSSASCHQGSRHTRLVQQEVRIHGEGPLDWAVFVDLRHDLLLATGDAVGTASCKGTGQVGQGASHRGSVSHSLMHGACPGTCAQ